MRSERTIQAEESKWFNRKLSRLVAKWMIAVLLLTVIQSMLVSNSIASASSADISIMTTGVYGFGSNSSSELGQSDTGESNYSSPIRIPGLTDVLAISAGGYAGEYHSLVLTGSGEVYSFGNGWYGELGHGDTNNQSSPKKIEGLENVKTIAAGGTHSLVLTNAGEVYSFGNGLNGQLGHGDNVNQSTPMKIDGIEMIKAIAAGAHHSLLLTEGGEVYSFGYGWTGQLGHGDTTSINIPQKIAGLEHVKQLSSTGNHALILMENGEVYSFGQGYYGQLGHGDLETQSSPQKIDGLEDVKEVAAGGVHSLVLLQNGEVYSFGYGGYGQLGHGDKLEQTSPKKIEGLATVKMVATGWDHSLILMETDEVYSFGEGGSGQLGLGEMANETSPQPIDGIEKAKSINAGYSHSLVINDVPLIPLSVNRTSYDKNPSEQEEIIVSATLNGSMLSGLWNGTEQLVQDTDYSVVESVYNVTDESYEEAEITIHQSYLSSLTIGSTTLVIGFDMSGSDKSAQLELSVSDTTPNNSQLSLSQSSFDKWNQNDITLTLSLNGNTLTGVQHTDSSLILDTDYVARESGYNVTENTYEDLEITLHKSYLSSLPTGNATLTFNFSAGESQELALLISDSDPSNSGGAGSATDNNNSSEDEDFEGGKGFLTPGVSLRTLVLIMNEPIPYLYDVSGHWAEEPILYFIEHQLVSGYPDESFNPNKEISRAEFIMLLSRMFEVSNSEVTMEFQDVEQHWAQSEIAKFASAGVIQGYEAGMFHPDQFITREEIVVVLSRIIQLQLLPELRSINFVDIEMAADYAHEVIALAGNAGILSGTGNGEFNPEVSATRAEVVQMLMNTLNLLQEMLDSRAE